MIFDCLWIGQVLVAVVPGIVLFYLRCRKGDELAFALVLAVYCTLSEVSRLMEHIGVDLTVAANKLGSFIARTMGTKEALLRRCRHRSDAGRAH